MVGVVARGVTDLAYESEGASVGGMVFGMLL
jgi:hypothetical protein